MTTYVEDEEDNDGDGYNVSPFIMVSDQKCQGFKLEDFGELSKCVTIDRCPERRGPPAKCGPVWL